MAMNVGGSGGGPRADINVTPLVDVVLVLLIIFLVVSPAATFQVPNALPRTGTVTTAALTAEQVAVEFRDDGQIYFMGELTTGPNLPQQLRGALQDRLERTVFFVAGDEVDYGSVVRWMAVAKREGATTVALQVKPPAPTTEPGSGANP